MRRDDQGLVRRFRDGERGGFEALYDAYGPRLYRFCYRLCGRVADAEDLTQEVFLAAYQSRERFAGHASVATWLYRIALYRWRRLFGGRDAEIVSLNGAEEPMVPDLAPVVLERLALEHALAALPETLCEAFLLVKAEGLKYREAADVLGIPQGTVQSRVHDAAVRLRELLAEPADGEAAMPSGGTGSQGTRARHWSEGAGAPRRGGRGERSPSQEPHVACREGGDDELQQSARAPQCLR